MTNTAADARQVILAAIENAGRDAVLAELVRWNNTTDNDIDANGDVWVSNPQAGHWLDEERLMAFATFLQMS